MSEKLQCAKCTKTVCNSKYFDQGAATCPTQTRLEIIEKVKVEFDRPEIREFSRQALLQHNEAILQLPEGGVVPRNPRVEETAQFARKMGYKKLGIVFCSALRYEAKILDEILENRGFEVASICCMAGGRSSAITGTLGIRRPPEKPRGYVPSVCSDAMELNPYKAIERAEGGVTPRLLGRSTDAGRQISACRAGHTAAEAGRCSSTTDG